MLRPLPEGRTRLLVGERPVGCLKAVAPRRSGLLQAAGSVVNYVIGDPLHFAMVRKMMLGSRHGPRDRLDPAR
jgi:hypothetical protein